MFDGFETCGSILSRLMLFDLLLFIAREMRRCCSRLQCCLRAPHNVNPCKRKGIMAHGRFHLRHDGTCPRYSDQLRAWITWVTWVSLELLEFIWQSSLNMCQTLLCHSLAWRFRGLGLAAAPDSDLGLEKAIHFDRDSVWRPGASPILTDYGFDLWIHLWIPLIQWLSSVAFLLWCHWWREFH